MSESEKPVTAQRISEFAWGFAPPLMLWAGIKNRVFDVLDRGPKNLSELAAATGASPRGLRALLEALNGFGIVERKGDLFSLPPDTSAFLVSTKPGNLCGLIQHLTGQLLDTWRELPEIVRTGKPAASVNRHDSGAEFFSKFVEDLFNMNYPGAKALADDLAGKFPSGKVNVLDIAAGSGVWGIALAQRIPQAQITAVDWPEVTPVTRRVAQRHKLADRLRTIEGDLNMVDFGSGFHIATLGHILHSEGETKSRRLLKKIYDCLAPGGVIAIAEFVPNDDRSGPPYPLIFAVNMLVHTDEGDTFTFAQMSSWLKEIGFQQIRQVQVPAPSPILVATKP
jgi:ubiquinone/menaquinone biosynthesis C-methylase UbiE